MLGENTKCTDNKSRSKFVSITIATATEKEKESTTESTSGPVLAVTTTSAIDFKGSIFANRKNRNFVKSKFKERKEHKKIISTNINSKAKFTIIRIKTKENSTQLPPSRN